MTASALSSVPVAVLGAGSWGTALAALACQRASTMIWARNLSSVAQINQDHQLPHYLPGIQLPTALQATADFEHAVAHALNNDQTPGLIILGVPLAGLAEMCQRLNHVLPRNANTLFISCAPAKGLTLKRVSYLIKLHTTRFALNPGCTQALSLGLLLL